MGQITDLVTIARLKALGQRLSMPDADVKIENPRPYDDNNFEVPKPEVKE